MPRYSPCDVKFRNTHLGFCLSCDTIIHHQVYISYIVCIYDFNWLLSGQKIQIYKVTEVRVMVSDLCNNKVVVTFTPIVRFIVMLTRSCSPEIFLHRTLRPTSLFSYNTSEAPSMVYSKTYSQPISLSKTISVQYPEVLWLCLKEKATQWSSYTAWHYQSFTFYRNVMIYLYWCTHSPS